MVWQLIVSGLALGAISGFHCIGMCGPIAVALPLHHLSPNKKIPGLLLYNIGRVCTYATLGLIFGFTGRQVYLGGFQKGFSIALGIIILFFLLENILKKRWFQFSFTDSINGYLKKIISVFISKRQLYGMLMVGMANGLLPCGMVYFAIAGALATGSVQGGVLFMASFGLGTIPFMLLISYFGLFIGVSTRNTIKNILPYLMGCMAILLILRGMSLGIPYLSPLIENTPFQTVNCH